MRVLSPAPASSVSHANSLHVMERAPAKRYIWGPGSDFWALGGASLLVWALFLLADVFRGNAVALEQRFGQIAVVFSFLSLVVNYPHFMISYRFGYGRGAGFVFEHWISLLAVPLGMLATFGLAFFAYNYDVSGDTTLLSIDAFLHRFGLNLGIPDRGALGRELLSISIWLMYFTVGWHYSKQAFGAMVVYAKMRGYQLTPRDRLALKWNLLGVGFYQFLYLNRRLFLAGSAADPRFPGVPITGFELPDWLYGFSIAFLVVSTLLAAWTFFDLFVKRGHRPDPTFLVCWASFLVWWIPVKNLPEFYAMAVPFFHSLQYLLFASKLESAKEGPHATARLGIVAVIAAVAGFVGFEILPSTLDIQLATSLNQSAWFFMATAAIFINVHHFFIDAVVWKFDQNEVKRAFFG